MRDEPRLQPLIDQYGKARVWDAGIEALGYPPTWQLGEQSLVKVAEVLILKS